ncbi:MAG: ATP-binding protein [Alphaproteobacteria bacterium]
MSKEEMPSKKRSALKNDSFFEHERENIHRQILSAVSHDLKTPLAAIIGSLEICERMKGVLSPARNAELLTTALQEAYRLDSFVTNILDMARLENGLVKFRKEICHFDSLLRDCIIKSGHYSQVADVKLSCPATGMEFETDPGLFSRVIGLMLDNAIKHSGPAPVIRVAVEVKDERIIIQVMDDGPGIPPDRIEEIFFKYTRITRQDHQNAGTGLGLSIGRQIAGLLGGKLFAGNRPEGGAIFTLDIPVGSPPSP